VVPKAIWKGIVLADSESTIMVEGNHYFPPDAVNKQFFEDSQSHTTCPWKGKASYLHVRLDGQINYDSAWYYPDPSEAAKIIKDYVAFWRGVEVIP
jgi:uncharacterized protein (DUF427 family)